jgi:nicotinamidase/pyrazinamidase
VVGTKGAELHPDLDRRGIDEVFDKGRDTAAYSGFEGRSAGGIGLEDALRQAGIEELDVVGIATDYCVKATALDGLKAGFKVNVLPGLVVGVAPDSSRAALEQMQAGGARIPG